MRNLDLTPCTSGAHWWRAWYALQQACLDADLAVPEPARLTRMVLDLLRSQSARAALLATRS